jgi:hypothetical protein
MREILPGVADQDLPPQAKMRFFCKFHQQQLGVMCSNKLQCARCGWNPDVDAARKKKTRERMEREYDSRR